MPLNRITKILLITFVVFISNASAQQITIKLISDRNNNYYEVSNRFLNKTFEDLCLPIPAIAGIDVLDFYICSSPAHLFNTFNSSISYALPEDINIAFKKDGYWGLINLKSGKEMYYPETDTIIPFQKHAAFESGHHQSYPYFILKNNNHYFVTDNSGMIIFNDTIFELYNKYPDRIILEYINNFFIGDYLVVCKNCTTDIIKTKGSYSEPIHPSKITGNFVDTIAFSPGEEFFAIGEGLYNVLNLKTNDLLFKKWSKYLRVEYVYDGNDFDVAILNDKLKTYEGYRYVTRKARFSQIPKKLR